MPGLQSTNKLDRGCQQLHHLVKPSHPLFPGPYVFTKFTCSNSTQVLHMDPKISKNKRLITLTHGNNRGLVIIFF